MKTTLIILLSLLLLTLIILSCSNFRKSDKRYTKTFSKSPVDIQIKYHTHKGLKGRYVEASTLTKQTTLIFIHGAPGSSSAFTHYVKDSSLTDKFNIIIIDRPGYGYSDYGTYYSIESQATWLVDLVKTHMTHQDIFLIGHSFGGPIAVYGAQQLGSLINGSIMIAPAIDPESEKYFFGGKLTWKKPTRWFFSKAWQVAADEKYNHSEELRRLEPLLSEIETPVLHIHGTQDKIAPYANLAYSKKHLPPSILETYSWENIGHLIPFTARDTLIDLIIPFVNKHLKLTSK